MHFAIGSVWRDFFFIFTVFSILLFQSCPLCSVFCWHCVDVYCTETAIYGTLALKQTPPVNTHCVTDLQSHNHAQFCIEYNISCYRTMSAWLTIKTQLRCAVLYDCIHMYSVCCMLQNNTSVKLYAETNPVPPGSCATM